MWSTKHTLSGYLQRPAKHQQIRGKVRISEQIKPVSTSRGNVSFVVRKITCRASAHSQSQASHQKMVLLFFRTKNKWIWHQPGLWTGREVPDMHNTGFPTNDSQHSGQAECRQLQQINQSMKGHRDYIVSTRGEVKEVARMQKLRAVGTGHCGQQS